MPRPRTHIIDYGSGNLMSVARALDAVGSEAAISADAREVRQAERVILPGVGAFGLAMAALSKDGLASAVVDVAQEGTPVFGICLGMQLLFQSSSEFGQTSGLGLISGKVDRIVDEPERGGLRATHVGWRPLEWNPAVDNLLTASARASDSFYFAHSYAAWPESSDNVWASVTYGRNRLAALVGNKNIWGSQFHPEKSGTAGLALLRAFAHA